MYDCCSRTSRTGRKTEARLRETNWSSENWGLVDGLVTLTNENKALINKDKQSCIPTTPRETTATLRCQNKSNDLSHRLR